MRRCRRERRSLRELRGGENTESKRTRSSRRPTRPWPEPHRGPKAANEHGPDSPRRIARSPTPDDTWSTKPPRPWSGAAQVLVLEDLNVAGMVRNRHLARSISDAAMGELARQLLYKATWHGVEVRVADRFFPEFQDLFGLWRGQERPRPVDRTYAWTTAVWSSTATSTRPSTWLVGSPKNRPSVTIWDPRAFRFSPQPDPAGICTAKHAGRADRHPHNHHDNVMRALGRNRVLRRKHRLGNRTVSKHR